MKIYDPEVVGYLISKYSSEADAAMKEGIAMSILEECFPLVQFFVNMYNPVSKEDMAQDARIKVYKSLGKFDPSKANTHTYFSKVIRNACITHFHKDSRGAGECDLEDEDDAGIVTTYDTYSDQILKDMIARNRARFPSIESIIDEITEYIYYSMLDGLDKGRTAVRAISNMYHIPRCNSLVIYNSTLVYLRMHYDERPGDSVDTDEFSLAPEMEELIGSKAFSKMMNIFTGITVQL